MRVHIGINEIKAVKRDIGVHLRGRRGKVVDY